MIINGNNFPKKEQVFQNKTSKSLNKPHYQSPSNQYVNISDKNEMADRTFELLQENLSKGLISLDEFTKKCNNLRKFREKEK